MVIFIEEILNGNLHFCAMIGGFRDLSNIHDRTYSEKSEQMTAGILAKGSIIDFKIIAKYVYPTMIF